MGFTMNCIVVVVALLSLSISESFSFSMNSHATLQRARVIPGITLSQHSKRRGVPLSMSGETEETTTVTTAAGEKKPMPTSGTYYDDEVDPIPVTKVGISETMKERLIREASTGLDSDKKQTNVLLYIMAAVGVLVILGGKDILF